MFENEDLATLLAGRGDICLTIDTAASHGAELTGALVELCGQVERTPDPVTVVLHVRGGDPTGERWPVPSGVHAVNAWERVLRRLERLDAPVVVVIEGVCGGPALDLLLTADYRICTPDLQLRIPTAGGEVWPGMALHRLANQLGSGRARRLVLFGTTVTAELAERNALVDEVADDLVDAVTLAAKLVSGFGGSELAIRRRLLLDATTTSFEESLGAHLAACDRTLRRVAG